MEKKILYTTNLPSIIHNDEICAELVKISVREGYPVQKAKWNNALDKYVGFSLEHVITATKLPPIPGGWAIEISAFEESYHEMMVPVKSRLDAGGNEKGEINKFVLQMLDEFRKEGLKIEVGNEYEKVYGSLAKKVRAWGHPILLDKLDEFIENMR